MRLRFYQFPFIITLIAMPINWIIGFSGIGIINWIPEFFALAVCAVLIVFKPYKISLSKSQIFMFIVFSSHLVFQVLSGKGVGSSAVLSVILMVCLYLSFFKLMPVHNLSNKIIHQTNIIFIIHIFFILIESVLIITNNQSIFAFLSGGTYKAAKLESYTPVPQSIYKQSQAASQLCLFAMVWFGLLYLSRKKLFLRLTITHAFLFFATAIMFAMYPTTTAQIVGMILLLSIVYLMPVSNKRALRFFGLLIGLTFFESFYRVITYKLNEDLHPRAEVTINAFMDSLNIFFDMSLFSQLWGLGSFNSVVQNNLVHADFGIGVLILQMGIILAGWASLVLVVLFIKSQVFALNKVFDNPQCFLWIWLASVNSLLALGNLLSLVHYTVSLQTGGRALFSLHIAVTIFSLQQLVQYRRVSKAQVSQK